VSRRLRLNIQNWKWRDRTHTDSYSNHVKSLSWHKTVMNLNYDGINGEQTKLKWNILRSAFKRLLKNTRARKNGHVVDQYCRVTWPHFNRMIFVDSGWINMKTILIFFIFYLFEILFQFLFNDYKLPFTKEPQFPLTLTPTPFYDWEKSNKFQSDCHEF